MRDLFLYLESEHRRPGSALQSSLAAKLTCEPKRDAGSLRVREGFDGRRIGVFLRTADHWLNSANVANERFEALTGAAWAYVLIADATERSTEPWWSVHVVAYAVLGELLKAFGWRLRLDRDAQRRLYDEAIATAERLDTEAERAELEVTEPLLLLLKEFEPFLEELAETP